MVTHIELKNFPLSLIQRLKSVETSTGLRMEYLMQAALIQGLREATAQECGGVILPPIPEPVPAAASAGVPRPVVVNGADPDLNLR